MNHAEIISRISEKTGKTEEEITELIEKKRQDLPGVSEDGLASLVAREMNVFLGVTRELKINNIMPNMHNIAFLGKIRGMQPVREFNKNDYSGKVQNIILEDETGRIRMSLWNDEIDRARHLKEGDVIRLENVRTRRDNFGNPEARISYGGSITKTDAKIMTKEPKSSFIGLEEMDEVSAEATVLQVAERPLVYYFCPECRSKLSANNCMTHGTVDPRKTVIVSAMLDDGNAAINTVFFADTAEKFLGMDSDELEDELKRKSVSDYIASSGILSRKFKVSGNVRRNQLTNELEIRATNIEAA